jgi:hypothetical protein
MDFSAYFTQLSVGVLGLTPLVPWRAVGKGYYLVNLGVGLAFLPVAWFFRASTGGAAGAPADLLFAAYGVVAALAVLVFWIGPGESGFRLSVAAALLGAAAVAADGIRVAGILGAGGAASPAAVAPLLAFNFLSGALLLGSVLSAMLLGHWYLVVKDLPVRPLQVLTWTFFGALGARLVATLAAWALDPAGAARLADRSFLFVLVYGLFSLGTPLAMSWMVWGTVKIRSTQAATGILYGVTAFILMGEAAGRFLLVRTGFPL